MTAARAALGAALVLACLRAAADPNDYVRVPVVTEGESEFDSKFGSATRGERVDRSSAASLGWGRALTASWFSEAYVQYARQGDAGTRFDAVEFENLWVPAEPGEWPVDVGVVVEVEKPRDSAQGWVVTFSPLLQAEFGRTQLNANLVFTRSFASSPPSPTQLGYQFQFKYRYSEPFEFGLQGFGDVGAWNRWDPAREQSHRIGPAALGKLRLGGPRALRYNVGWLFGTTGSSPDRTLRAQLEYEY